MQKHFAADSGYSNSNNVTRAVLRGQAEYGEILDSGDYVQTLCLQYPHQGHLHIQITVDHLRRQT